MSLMLIALGFVGLIIAIVAVRDLTQRQHSVTRNFPVVGHFRYLLEEMGQPLRQYFFAGDLDERPYNRVTRSWVYASVRCIASRVASQRLCLGRIKPKPGRLKSRQPAIQEIDQLLHIAHLIKVAVENVLIEVCDN